MPALHLGFSLENDKKMSCHHSFFWTVNQLKSAMNRQQNHLLLCQMTCALTSSDWLRSLQLHYLCSVIGTWRDPTSCWEISERTAQRVLRTKQRCYKCSPPYSDIFSLPSVILDITSILGYHQRAWQCLPSFFSVSPPCFLDNKYLVETDISLKESIRLSRDRWGKEYSSGTLDYRDILNDNMPGDFARVRQHSCVFFIILFCQSI